MKIEETIQIDQAIADQILKKKITIFNEVTYIRQDVVIGMLSRCADQFKPKWIDVNERLPEEYTDVMVLTNDGVYGIDFINPADKGWTLTLTQCITHWMPLPPKP